MATTLKAPDSASQGTLEDVQDRLALVEGRFSDTQQQRKQLDAEVARQAQRLEYLTEENEKLEATRSELQFDLNACRDELAAAERRCVLLEQDNDGLRKSESRLFSVEAEFAETREQLAATRQSVALLEHDNEDLRQREAELLPVRTSFGKLQEEHARLSGEHARLSERQQQEAKFLEDKISELAGVRGELAGATRAVERLQMEKQRLVEANKMERQRLIEANNQARDRIAHLRAAISQARADNSELVKLVDRLADGLQLMIGSRRWRLGHSLVTLPRRLLFRRNPPVITDALLDLVKQYRDGRRSSSFNWQRLAEAAGTESSKSSEK